jgi:hypothetical protein
MRRNSCNILTVVLSNDQCIIQVVICLCLTPWESYRLAQINERVERAVYDQEDVTGYIQGKTLNNSRGQIFRASVLKTSRQLFWSYDIHYAADGETCLGNIGWDNAFPLRRRIFESFSLCTGRLEACYPPNLATDSLADVPGCVYIRLFVSRSITNKPS